MLDDPHQAGTGIVEAAGEEDMVEGMETGIEAMEEEEEEGTEEEEEGTEEIEVEDAAGMTTIVVDPQAVVETGIAVGPPVPEHITGRGLPVPTARGDP